MHEICQTVSAIISEMNDFDLPRPIFTIRQYIILMRIC